MSVLHEATRESEMKVIDVVKASFTLEEVEVILKKYCVDKSNRLLPPLSSVKWLDDCVILYFTEGE